MTPSCLIIRKIHPGDIEAVWELHNRALEGTGAHAGNDEWDKDLRSPMESYLDSGGNFLVCERERKSLVWARIYQ